MHPFQSSFFLLVAIFAQRLARLEIKREFISRMQLFIVATLLFSNMRVRIGLLFMSLFNCYFDELCTFRQ